MVRPSFSLFGGGVICSAGLRSQITEVKHTPNFSIVRGKTNSRREVLSGSISAPKLAPHPPPPQAGQACNTSREHSAAIKCSQYVICIDSTPGSGMCSQIISHSRPTYFLVFRKTNKKPTSGKALNGLASGVQTIKEHSNTQTASVYNADSRLLRSDASARCRTNHLHGPTVY